MEAIIYRPIKPSDFATVSDLTREAFHSEVPKPSLPSGAAPFLSDAYHAAMARRNRPGYIDLVAEVSDDLVGVLLLDNRNYISKLFVRATHQRMGIGRGLLAAAGELVPEPSIRVTINAPPNALPAFLSLGFRPTGPETYRHGIRFIPMEGVLVKRPDA